MSFLLQCLSHTPLKGLFDPEPAVVAEVAALVGELRAQVKAFDPELIVLFSADHYNGFFLDVMPGFCIGVQATSIGDYGTPAGALKVPRDMAEACATHVIANDVDIAVSYRMQVDHGFAQPLAELTGAIDRYPVVPVFVNSAAPPLPNFRRARRLGQAVGEFARGLGRRVLFIGSGGLSHNPPVPQIADAPPEVAERLIAGRSPTPEARRQRQERTIAVARQFATGDSQLHPLSPGWDRQFLADLVQLDWPALDRYDNATVSAAAGGSAHEVKSWVAAAAAMHAASLGRAHYEVRYHRPIPEWIAGYAAMTGRLAEVA